MSENQINNNTVLKTNSYKSIIRGFSFFGWVQIINILITLIRGKFVAVILGPEGMGISALFNSASYTIQRFSSIGLNQSIVRETSDRKENVETLDPVIVSSLQLGRITAFIGFIICATLCLPLSKLTFGDTDYWWQFILLGVAVAFMIYGGTKLSVLQGLQQVKQISRSSVIGGITGLFIGVPLYYIFGYKGIVPAMIAVALSLYIFYSMALSRCLNRKLPSLSWHEWWPVAKILLLLGIVLMAGEVLANLVTYLINLYIRYHGGVDDVGLYQAAYSVTTQYAGVVFAAMAMDYFPRLSQVARDNEGMNLVVNRQSETVAWIMTPAVTLLFFSAPIVVQLLLADSFHSVIPLLRWMGFGMLLRAFSFPMGYITFAKGNKKVFFLLEGLTANVLTLLLSCVCYHFFGLIGLGYALVADNGICLVLYYVVNRYLYNYRFSTDALLAFIIGGSIGLAAFIVSFLPNRPLAFTLMGLASLAAIIWGWKNLRGKFFEGKNVTPESENK